MSSSMTHNSSSLPRTARLLSLAAVLTVISLQSTSRADIGTLGDVNVVVDPLGYVPGSDSGDLIIGNSDVGGLTMDVALQPDPLRSPTGIIGNLDSSIGRATFTGFPSDWLIGTSLIVGNEGQGFLDLFNSAKVQVGDLDEMTSTDIVAGSGITTLGFEETGQGIVTINGVASRLVTADLIVGDLGVGEIEVTARGALFSADAILGNSLGGNGTVSLTDLGSRWTVGDSTTTATLTVGNLLGTGRGGLNIANQALVQVSGTTFINRDGRVNLSTGGRLRQLPSTVNPIVNNGIIAGDGFVEGTVLNGQFGQIRNAAGIANTREKLVFSGPVDNSGLIETIGGELEFHSLVDNTIDGDIIARDGILRFNAGLINDGELALGGDTTFYGDLTIGNTFIVLSDSSVVIRGNLFFAPPAVAALTIGPSQSFLDVIGSVDLGSSLLSLNYSSGIGSQPGDSYDIINASDGISGIFANTQAVADGRLWDIIYGPDVVTVMATAAVALPFGADFNGDGIVNQLDLQIWQANFGRTSPPDLSAFGDADGDGDVDGRDFMEIQRKFGGAPLVAASTAVPEPGSLVLLLGVVAGLGWRRG